MHGFFKGLVGGVIAAMLFFGGLTVVEGQSNGFTQVQSPEFTSIHGSACSPANQGQASELRAAVSQRGILNPNSVASGQSFFVVCPVVLVDDGSAQLGADVWVSVLYFDDRAPPVTCSAIRRTSFNDRPVRVVSSSISFTGSIELRDVVADSDGDFNALNTTVAVLCALQPRTAIQLVGFDSD